MSEPMRFYCAHGHRCEVAEAEVERLKTQMARRRLAVSLVSKNKEARVKAERERDEARARLPEEMRDCTILLKTCEKGHAWLTATNWVQHPCLVCERDEARANAKLWDEANAKSATERDQYKAKIEAALALILEIQSQCSGHADDFSRASTSSRIG